MPLDIARLLDDPPRVFRQSFTRRDTILYALGVGAGDVVVLDRGLATLHDAPLLH